MKRKLRIGKFEISQLHGGNFAMDAGATFGVVPKKLWQKKCAIVDPNNCMPLACEALLVRWDSGALVIETGLGNKLTAKQQAIFQVTSDWRLVADLAEHGLSPEDIDYVLLTHCDFDHASGVVHYDERGQEKLTFAKARHVIQEQEWHDANHPNIRSQNTYWAHNFEALPEENLFLVDGEREIVPGIRVIRTGGHTRGHQAVVIESAGESAIHLGDLFPTRYHANPLWVMAYDNYPLEAVEQKRTLLAEYQQKDAWFLFYHDLDCLACKLDADGEIMQQV